MCPRNLRLRTLAAALTGYGMGWLGNFVPFRFSLAIVSCGLLLFLFDFLKSRFVTQNCFRWSMVFGTAILGILIWLLPIILAGTPIERRIFLRERYGGEWQYPPGTHVILNKKSVLKKPFVEGAYYALTPAILNDNSQDSHVAVIVTMFLYFPSDIVVKQPRFWRPAEAREGFQPYFASISQPISPGIEDTVDETLQLKFPRPGQYRIPYSISGTAITTGKALKTVGGWFTIELTK